MDIQDAHATSGQHPDRQHPDRQPPDRQPPGRSAPGGPPAPGPHVRSYRIGGVSVVEIRGAVDVSTVAEIQVHTDAASAAPGAQAIVDLRAVTFLDCATLGLLCRTRRRALRRHGRLTVVCVRPWHLRILHIVGLARDFDPVPTIPDALGREH
ncbi:STAS domain-containing protein [Streptomyces sp. NPDC048518]|uniref:STAS domain-containing protein n=1 Tax=Streptomyces sp. NPDC048518 TaxID=3155029 RepID=UPI0033CCEF37